jgi:GNAT superfamily N-acetyltransferase
VARVHVETWKAAYVGIVPAEVLSGLTVESREAIWRESISRGSPELVVAKENDQVVGFISFGACRDAGVPRSVAEIWALYVLPDQWSRGVGRKIVGIFSSGSSGTCHGASLSPSIPRANAHAAIAGRILENA